MAAEYTQASAAANGLTLEESRVYQRLRKEVNPDEALDEPLAGETVKGTPVYPRTPAYFPAEPRDIFWEMDKVADENGELVPLDFDVNQDGRIDDVERNAIRGRNTWLLWGGGNEAFWGWLQEEGYGFVDFIIMADPDVRNKRFKEFGLINQPGFQNNEQPNKVILDRLGIRVVQGDKPPVRIDGESETDFQTRKEEWISPIMLPPKYERDATSYGNGYYPAETGGAEPHNRIVDPPVGIPPLPGNAHPDRALFEPGDRELYEAIKKAMPRDGLDYSVYGYPSGIFGLRYILNPDFFGNTKDAARARDYWQERVVESEEDYYDIDSNISADPKLVRPFRMSMSCGFCHIAPHPLIPPKDVEKPTWENLSSIIGNQFWKPQPCFANRAPKSNFLHHILKSQPPGTIDTSLVSTDHINNTNVINAIFDLPARLARAETKPPELQAGGALLFLGKKETDDPVPLHCPMVLFPGEDSVGVIPALARVPLNIGVYSEQWRRVDNPVIGFTPQRPFEVATCRTNSVHWMVNEKFRVPYMAAFFTLGTPPKDGGKPPVPKSTQAMKLEHAPGGELHLDSRETIDAGRDVFLNNCAICHSSKQPDGFDLRFSRHMEGGWTRSPAPEADEPPIYTLPSDYLDWEQFRKSKAFDHYRGRIRRIAGELPEAGPDPFLENNFLSNELRIPITLVGTNAGRAMATNATDGNVWDNYSSKTFKDLPSVGPIRYYNIFSDMAADPFGTNAEFSDGREKGGPGYMRPPSLISLWTSAPYFHNNALGLYNHNPSVAGRMEAFNDGIKKILHNDLRRTYTESKHRLEGDNERYPYGDLRVENSAVSADDPGYIYRVPIDTHFEFAAGYIPYLVKGLTGETLFAFLSCWIWIILVALMIYVAIRGHTRHAGILFLLLAAFSAAVLAFSGLTRGGGSPEAAFVMAAAGMLDYASLWWWIVPALFAVAGLWLSLTRLLLRWPVRVMFIVLTILTACTGIFAHKFLNGRLREINPVLALLPNSWTNGEFKGITVGPFPRGTPVDLIQNLDPEKRDKLPAAVIGIARANVRMRKEGLKGEEAYRVFAEEAGPGLIEASKSPDFVLDRGHWFGEQLTPQEKEDLIAFLKTL